MHKICSKFYTIWFSYPKIGEIFTNGSDKSHLSLPTCTKFASQLFLSNFSCSNTTTASRISSRKSSSFNSKVSGTATRPDHSLLRPPRKNYEVGHGWKWWFCHWCLLSGGKYPSFENQICKFYVFLYDYSLRPFLVWVSKDLLYCLSTRATNPNNFLPFHNDLNQIDQILIICSKRYNADCRVSKLIIFISCSP